jgi:hypothetical protein
LLRTLLLLLSYVSFVLLSFPQDPVTVPPFPEDPCCNPLIWWLPMMLLLKLLLMLLLMLLLPLLLLLLMVMQPLMLSYAFPPFLETPPYNATCFSSAAAVMLMC